MVASQEYLKRQIFHTNSSGKWIGQTLEDVRVVFKSVSSGYNLLEYGDLINHTCIVSTEFNSIFMTYEALENENFKYFSSIWLCKIMRVTINDFVMWKVESAHIKTTRLSCIILRLLVITIIWRRYFRHLKHRAQSFGNILWLLARCSAVLMHRVKP